MVVAIIFVRTLYSYHTDMSSRFTSPDSQASSQFLAEMLNDEDIVSHVILGSVLSILTIWDFGIKPAADSCICVSYG
jgi:hypothetical protein